MLMGCFGTTGVSARDPYRDLTPQQIADLEVEAAKKRSENLAKKETPAPVPTPISALLPAAPKETVVRAKEWAEVGQQLGQAIAVTAKELNIAVNDFVKTPVGMMTAGIVIYSYLGKDFITGSLKVMFIALYFIVWFYMTQRFLLVKDIQIVQCPWKFAFMSGVKIRKVTVYNSGPDMKTEAFLVSAISALIGMVLFFRYVV